MYILDVTTLHMCMIYLQFSPLHLDAAVNSGELWFVNFYSPRCSHCHDLAPTVRKPRTLKIHWFK